MLWSRRSQRRDRSAPRRPRQPRRPRIRAARTSRAASARSTRATRASGATLYDRARRASSCSPSGGQGFCTAFAVRPERARDQRALRRRRPPARRHHRRARERGPRAASSFPVSDMRAHPGYRDARTRTRSRPTSASSTISGRAAVVLELAAAAELAAARRRRRGVPHRLPGPADGRPRTRRRPSSPRTSAASPTRAGRPGAFADTWLVQHDAPTTHGTSGSPIFDGKGHVVAINAGGYVEGDEADHRRPQDRGGPRLALQVRDAHRSPRTRILPLTTMLAHALRRLLWTLPDAHRRLDRHLPLPLVRPRPDRRSGASSRAPRAPRSSGGGASASSICRAS